MGVLVVFLLLLSSFCNAADEIRHEPGVCAMKGHCGKKSFFGGQLNCPYNEPAEAPSSELREALVGLCGDKWTQGLVCCDEDQVKDLKSNLERAQGFIESCPACKENFFDFFCTFTCSPDQSTFVNVTATEKASTGKDMVTEVSYYVSPKFGEGFYHSCENVQFSATNGRVMDLIGGGAKNYTAFFKFLGDTKPFGSPFQINFPRNLPNNMRQFNDVPQNCASKNPKFRCACVDCPDACPSLPELSSNDHSCHVGILPCISFVVIIAYTIGLIAFLGGVVGKQVLARRERPLRLSARRHHGYDELEGDYEDDEDEGDEADLIDDDMTSYSRQVGGYIINTFLYRAFYRLGYITAKSPVTTIIACLVTTGLLSIGWIRFSVESNPVRLWVGPDSRAASEKAYFDDAFGPFYRSEMVFLSNATSNSSFLTYDTLRWWFSVEERARNLDVDGVRLSDVCFKPTGDACVVQSVTGYWKGDFSRVNKNGWKRQLADCVSQPVSCLPEFSQPLKRNLILSAEDEAEEPADSRALVTTWVLSNGDENSDVEKRAIQWENGLQKLLKGAQSEASDRGLRMSFSTDISLEQELNKSTNTDAKIIVISYVVMFLYASIALGNTFSYGQSALIESKFTLGLFGVVIVLISVSASVGLFSAFGLKVTLIIAEVIPFFVLAVGVDNIFLLSHEFERMNSRFADETIEMRVARTVARVGPSILLSGMAEVFAFIIGAFVSMPAVRNFAIYAAGAVFVDAILQVTMFTAALALDQRRTVSGRFDCFPCFKTRRNGQYGGFHGEGLLSRFIRKVYAPNLLKEKVKGVVVLIFLGLLAASLSALPFMDLGLDQRVAIPTDSYLIDYFDDMYAYFDSGPPVYFVNRNADVTSRSGQQQLCGRFASCNEFSLSNIVEQERKRPEASYIADPVASWVDDYLFWLNPALSQCCRVRRDGPEPPESLCTKEDNPAVCKICFEDRQPSWNITMHGLPEGQEFMDYLGLWLTMLPDEDCVVAGKAGYSNALLIDQEHASVTASHFRTSHTPLHSQSQFIESYKAARRISDTISSKTGLDIYPYSLHYIFFDQYIGIVRLTVGLLVAALAVILLLSTILLGSARTALVLTATVGMIVIDVMGVMVIWKISLNAISLVNLVISVGIGVEFCSHLARAFTVPLPSSINLDFAKRRDKDERAWMALVGVGASVSSLIFET